jgi:hypothetical protein
MLADSIVDSIYSSGLLKLLFTFNLFLSDVFAFSICDSSSLARTLLLSRLR